MLCFSLLAYYLNVHHVPKTIKIVQSDGVGTPSGHVLFDQLPELIELVVGEQSCLTNKAVYFVHCMLRDISQ